jgi:hypothetical protein
MLIGATYQGVATAWERRQFPRPGGMVDVGGHQLHIYCYFINVSSIAPGLMRFGKNASESMNRPVSGVP